MNQDTSTPVYVPVTRAEYYPPESEVGDKEIGILDMDTPRLVVMHHVHDVGTVTLAAPGSRKGTHGFDEVLSYELDLTSVEARRLSQLLSEAAEEADRP